MAQHINITLEELRQLYARIDRQALESEDWLIFAALVSGLIGRTEARQARMLAKLRAADAQQTTEGTGPVLDGAPPLEHGAPGAADPPGRVASGSSPTDASAAVPPHPAAGADEKPKPKGHGRNGAAAFVNAKHVMHALIQGIVGALCAACGVGSMSPYREKVIVRVVGQSLFGAAVHHFEQARCRLCGAIIRAEGSQAILVGLGTSYITYDWSACAMLIVMHYFAGAPFKRLESLHEGWGVPMPHANQWELADKSADLLLPLYKAMEKHGVHNATTLRIDDTGSMVIETRRRIQAEIAALERVGESTTDVRTGINATGVYLETEDATVILLYTGLHHAGEIVDQLLRHREVLKQKLVKVTDAASKNFDHAHADELEEAVCNAHAFLEFRAVKDKHPDEYAIAAEVYKKVFDNDDQAKALGLTPEDRMLHHQLHSKPEMEKLEAMCKEKLGSKLVEPRSALWEPLSFIINQWPRLTKFYEVPGVPLDTNIVEQILIIPVRYLAGSFNYKTQNGAEVGDLHMSLIATANANGVEPVAFLADCLRNHEDLAERPEHYLPWVYRDRLEQSTRVGPAAHPLVPGPAPPVPIRGGRQQAAPAPASHARDRPVPTSPSPRSPPPA